MNLTEIRAAIAEGKTVHWHNAGYVVRGSVGNELITFTANENSVALTYADGVTLTSKESEFFISLVAPINELAKLAIDPLLEYEHLTFDNFRKGKVWSKAKGWHDCDLRLPDIKGLIKIIGATKRYTTTDIFNALCGYRLLKYHESFKQLQYNAPCKRWELCIIQDYNVESRILRKAICEG